jgi:hypothetical protein
MRAIARGTILALLLALFASANSQAAQITSGLLVDINVANPSSYSGSGNLLTDLAGTNNSATLTNGPTYQSVGGKAIVTDGTNDYLEIANTSELQPSIGSAFTLQVYGQLTSFVSGEGILSKQYGLSGGYDGYSLMLSGTNGLSLYMNGSSVNGNYSSANNVISLNTWTLFTIVVRFGGGALNPSKVYVNNTEVVSVSNSESGIPTPQAPIRIASGIHEGTPYSAMKIGAFAMYNRALTPTEISDNLTYYTNYVPDNTAPTITSGTSFSAAENQTQITTLTADETSTWTLRLSDDSNTVNLNSSTGVLTFKSAPNFEAPADANSNNIYQVTVRATDGNGNFSDTSLSITVTDVDENTSVTISFSVPPQKGVTTVITATLTAAGKTSFMIRGKRIPGCANKASSGSPIRATCSWKPTVSGSQLLSVSFIPTDPSLNPSAYKGNISVTPRVGLR